MDNNDGNATAFPASSDSAVEPVQSDFQRQGSIRKVLHSLVGNESLVGKSAKMLDRPKTKFDDETFSESFKEYSVISEYNILCDHLIPGLYTVPSAKSRLVWFGVLFVRTGLYQGGIFRFLLLIPDDFPMMSPPRVVFESDIFHPAVDPSSRELNVRSVFPKWSQMANHLWQVLEYTHSIFQQISVKSPLNSEAALMYESDRSTFNQKAEQCAQNSVQAALTNGLGSQFASDAHYIRFSDYDESIHGDTKYSITHPSQDWQHGRLYGKMRGLSWVQPGSHKPCSRPTVPSNLEVFKVTP